LAAERRASSLNAWAEGGTPDAREGGVFIYKRLRGYDAITAVVDDLLPRLRQDSLLGRFWTSPRSVDTNNREHQLALAVIVSAAGGPTIYLGRDMKLAHTGMGISMPLSGRSFQATRR
jgi:hypothetical protein